MSDTCPKCGAPMACRDVNGYTVIYQCDAAVRDGGFWVDSYQCLRAALAALTARAEKAEALAQYRLEALRARDARACSDRWMEQTGDDDGEERYSDCQYCGGHPGSCDHDCPTVTHPAEAPMRIPERCPWCGAPENIRADGVRTGTYACGWYMGRDKSKCTEHTAPADYHETLAWRKRLSQILGISLSLVRSPDSTGVSTASWRCGKQSIVIYRGQTKWVLACPMFGKFAARQAEARRRLLAMGGER